MKITLFTANQSRHNYLINHLSRISSELFVVQENDTRFPGTVPGHYPSSEIYEDYFKNVREAEKKIFGEKFLGKDFWEKFFGEKIVKKILQRLL